MKLQHELIFENFVKLITLKNLVERKIFLPQMRFQDRILRHRPDHKVYLQKMLKIEISNFESYKKLQKIVKNYFSYFKNVKKC